MCGDFVLVEVITLSIEVPAIFDRRASHALCVQETFFEAQSSALRRLANQRRVRLNPTAERLDEFMLTRLFA